MYLLYLQYCSLYKLIYIYIYFKHGASIGMKITWHKLLLFKKYLYVGRYFMSFKLYLNQQNILIIRYLYTFSLYIFAPLLSFYPNSNEEISLCKRLSIIGPCDYLSHVLILEVLSPSCQTEQAVILITSWLLIIFPY